MSEAKPVILTCAQPTGVLTIGNYIGAVKNWTTMQEDFDCYFGIVDMHAITVRRTPAELRKASYSCLAQYIACGLDPEKSSLFIQSHVIGHAELAWVLGCHTPIGDLQRMTQFKEKASRLGFEVKADGDDVKFSHEGAKAQASINSGLLYYPVLMAADILLYNADAVPVGEDQRQHLELTRDLAGRFNHTYSPTFNVPKPYIPKAGAKIMSLQEPTKKMSKSDEHEGGTIYLLETPDKLRKKIMSAVTDSDTQVRYDTVEKPGISNLLTLQSVLSGKSIDELEKHYEGANYATFKSEVADVVVDTLKPVQDRYDAVINEKSELDKILKAGAEKAQSKAYKTLAKVYRKIGFAERVR